LAVTPRQTSCGVIVTDGRQILLGHATRSPRWDIPKGVAETGESFADAAARELREETGLVAAAEELKALGVHPYLRGKDLALFAWLPEHLPDPRSLVCTSHFALANGTLLPEFDRFGLFSWDDALTHVGKSMAQVLASLSREVLRRNPANRRTRRPRESD
jgi:8-oxo-dGTP pyrophosphatase MutT (NUDIX family)